MLKSVSRVPIASSWFAGIVLLFAMSVVMGANVSISASELWLLACFAPPTVMLFVWRPPTPTFAELLSAVNQPDLGGRR